MTIWDIAKADSSVWFNDKDFAEWITWKDQEGILADKRMQAIIDRRGPEFDIIGEGSGLTSESVRLTIINDAVEGLTSVRTGDIFRLVVRMGDAERDCKTTEIVDTSPASFTVEVEG